MIDEIVYRPQALPDSCVNAIVKKCDIYRYKGVRKVLNSKSDLKVIDIGAIR